jgi:hypothetical protein
MLLQAGDQLAALSSADPHAHFTSTPLGSKAVLVPPTIAETSIGLDRVAIDICHAEFLANPLHGRARILTIAFGGLLTEEAFASDKVVDLAVADVMARRRR